MASRGCHMSGRPPKENFFRQPPVQRCHPPLCLQCGVTGLLYWSPIALVPCPLVGPRILWSLVLLSSGPYWASQEVFWVSADSLFRELQGSSPHLVTAPLK